MESTLYQNEFKPSLSHFFQPMETSIRYIVEGNPRFLKQQIVQIPTEIECFQENRPPILEQQIIQVPYKKPRVQLISKQQTIKPRRESFHHFSFPPTPIPYRKFLSGYGHGVYSNIFAGYGRPTYSPYYIPPYPTNQSVAIASLYYRQNQQTHNTNGLYNNKQFINTNGLMNGFTFQTNYPNYVASNHVN
jgi:hypothetical protein